MGRQRFKNAVMDSARSSASTVNQLSSVNAKTKISRNEKIEITTNDGQKINRITSAKNKALKKEQYSVNQIYVQGLGGFRFPSQAVTPSMRGASSQQRQL